MLPELGKEHIALACRVSPLTAGYRLRQARTLCSPTYAPLHDALLAGQATPGHLHLLRELLDPLTARLVVKVIGTPVNTGVAARPVTVRVS